jgi:hypothetical protein
MDGRGRRSVQGRKAQKRRSSSWLVSTPGFYFLFVVSSSTYDWCNFVGLMLPSNFTLRTALPNLGTAVTTPVRALIFRLRSMPNSVNRTRSPTRSARVI